MAQEKEERAPRAKLSEERLSESEGVPFARRAETGFKSRPRTGELQTEAVKQENGQVHYKIFDKGGALKEEWDIDQDGESIGPYKEYYENGSLLYEYTYRNRKIEGPVRKYSPDGSLISEQMFRRGKDISPGNK